jgi:SAM-dependent methyltransferase
MTKHALNLGCGRRKRDDCINVDSIAELNPDVVWNLDQRPYPFPRGSFDQIWAYDVIEHLERVDGFLEEAHDLLSPGGVIEITTPHFSSPNSFRDPTHRHHLSYFSLDYFTAGHSLNFYSKARFEVLERNLVFNPSPVDRVVAHFANRNPARYEKRFAWLFPAWFIIFRLKAIK